MHSQYWQRNVKNKNKQNFSTQPTSKKQKPKPDWTTDFIDRSQYKLSETELIQKKAALQSKHRQQAKRSLEERRKKLQTGIIDDETKKIYETALTSKNIDINPPVRRNLTQMIRQQKQRKRSERYDENEQDDYSQSDDDDQEDLEEEDNENQQDYQQDSRKDIKDAQAFIKKFQRAKKQEKIERAVEILTNNESHGKNANSKAVAGDKKKHNNRRDDVKVNNFLDYFPDCNNGSEGDLKRKNLPKNSRTASQYSQSQDDAINNIEDTIKFMEEKLFAAKRTVEENSKSFISVVPDDGDDDSYGDKVSNNKKQKPKKRSKSKQHFKKKPETGGITQPSLFTKKSPSTNNPSENYNYNEQHHFNFKDENQQQFNQKMAEISQLRIKLKEQESYNQNSDGDDYECMDTIRRMRELMESRIEDNDSNQEERGNNYSNRNMNTSVNMNKNMNSMNKMQSPSLPLTSSIHKNSSISHLHHNYSSLNSDVEVSFQLTANDDDSQYQHDKIGNDVIDRNHLIDSLGQNSMIKNHHHYSQEDYQGDTIISSKEKWQIKPNHRHHQQQSKNFNENRNINKSTSPPTDSYEDEYEKIKQNLFQCLGEQGGEEGANAGKQIREEEEEDSLIVDDKINMWKQELSEEGDNTGNTQQILPVRQRMAVSTTSAHFLKQQDDDDDQGDDQGGDCDYESGNYRVDQQGQSEEEKQEDSSSINPYRYNCFNKQQHTASKKQAFTKNSGATFESNFFELPISSKKENLSSSSNPSHLKVSSSATMMMKKPPIMSNNNNNKIHRPNDNDMSKMKSMISDMSNNVQKIQIKPLKIEPIGGSQQGEMLGFDFRGSINIKKNILTTK